MRAGRRPARAGRGEEHHRLVINFIGVERLSSWVVGAVATVHRRCALARGGALKVCGLEPQLAAIFRISGLAQTVPFFPDENAAINSPWPDAPDLRPLPVAVLTALTRSGDGPPRGVGEAPCPAFGLDPAALPLPDEDLPPMSGVWLVAQVGPSKGRPIAVAGAKFVIGRDPSCHLRPGAAAVSRYHAAIERRGRRSTSSATSAAPTARLLNGRALRAEEAELRDGDVIQSLPALEFTLAVGPQREEPTPGSSTWPPLGARHRPRAARPAVDDESPTAEFPIPEGLDGALPLKQEVLEGVIVVTPLTADPGRRDDRPAPRRTVRARWSALPPLGRRQPGARQPPDRAGHRRARGPPPQARPHRRGASGLRGERPGRRDPGAGQPRHARRSPPDGR